MLTFSIKYIHVEYKVFMLQENMYVVLKNCSCVLINCVCLPKNIYIFLYENKFKNMYGKINMSLGCLETVDPQIIYVIVVIWIFKPHERVHVQDVKPIVHPWYETLFDVVAGGHEFDSQWCLLFI